MFPIVVRVYVPAQYIYAVIDAYMLVLKCIYMLLTSPQITRGMKAARQADTCRLKGAILGLARDHAARLGQKLDVGLRKDQRGLKDEATACLFLPHKYRNKYLSNPEK